jgi:hypothetical protein
MRRPAETLGTEDGRRLRGANTVTMRRCRRNAVQHANRGGAGKRRHRASDHKNASVHRNANTPRLHSITGPPFARSVAKRSEHEFGRAPRARNEVSTRGRTLVVTDGGNPAAGVKDFGQSRSPYSCGGGRGVAVAERSDCWCGTLTIGCDSGQSAECRVCVRVARGEWCGLCRGWGVE